MTSKLEVGQAVELIRLKVRPENILAFLQGRQKVDEFTSSLKGYIGTEILQLNDEEFLLLIRWDNESVVKDAQAITASVPVISEWLTKTAQFVSFETGIIKYRR